MSSEYIGIAMSGGVDSTATALLLRRQHRVSGFLMDIGQPDFDEVQDRVHRLAERIGIDIQVVDLKDQFRTLVIGYASSTYLAGRTPNPCMICNHLVKLGLFMDRILAAGADRVATGHYARVGREEDGTALYKGVDRTKDQSYFLARLTRQQLEQVVFPLGAGTKEQTYRLVEAEGFTDFRGRESQDICFLKGTSLAAFLAGHLSAPAVPGPIVTTSGQEIGRHDGLHHYTIGQRRGLGLPDHAPWYVCAIEADTNRLVVGRDEDLFASHLRAVTPAWLTGHRIVQGQTFLVKIRSTHVGAEAAIDAIDPDGFTLRFQEPQRAISPGQFAVLYDGDRVIGSGEITGHLNPATSTNA